MADIINSEIRPFIDISFNNTIKNSAEKIIERAEERVKWYGNQWAANDVVKGGVCILLKPGDLYDWHFDNMDFSEGKLTCPRPTRYWTQVIYLTEGTPLEIGNWNPKANRVWETEFSAPVPSKTLATIFPTPGKIVQFPCYMVHRIKPPVTNRRWTITTFVDQPNYKSLTKKNLEKGYKWYFNES